MSTLLILGSEVEVSFTADLSQIGRLPTRPRRANVVQVILHHDACFLARGCFAALKGRGLSTHFRTDNDGSGSQFADQGLCEV